MLASLGIPTVLVSGDQTTTAEARDFLGESVTTVTVDQAPGRTAAIRRPPSDTKPELTAAAATALAARADVPRHLPDQPWRLELDLNTLTQAERASRTVGVEPLASQRFLILGASPWERYRPLWAALRAARYEPAARLA